MIYDLQKASVWKRISAFLFDAILFGVVAVLFAWGLSAALGYDKNTDTLRAAFARYGEEYGVDLAATYDLDALDGEARARLEEAVAAFNADAEAVRAYAMSIQLTLVIVSVSLLLTCLGMEFVLPLILGNGQTLGKKLFSLGVMTAEGVKLRPVALFIRAILGKYTIEIMIPALILMMLYWNTIGIVGPLVLLAILIVQAVVIVRTPTNSPIHDLLASTVVIDLPSQMIFDTREEMIEYKKRVHAEQVARQQY